MKLRFFCEQCGTEVPRNTVRCPACGRYFTAIQCPQCGFRGSEEDFASGCPRCGYMRVQEVPARKRPRKDRRGRGGRSASGRTPQMEAGPPPSLYRIMGVVLLVLLGVLIAVLLLL